MSFSAELNFFRKAIENFHIDSHIVKVGDTFYSNGKIDRGLRSFFNMQEDYNDTFLHLSGQYKNHVLYLINDVFDCNYFIIMLSETNGEYLVVGPFLDEEITQERMMASAEKFNLPTQIFSQIEKYYANLPVLVNNFPLLSLCNTFCETLWGNLDNFTLEHINLNSSEVISADDIHYSEKKNEDSVFAISLLEERYETERKFMKAISQGMAHKAEQFIGASPTFTFEKRVADPVRNIKNYSIIMNTLLRKSAEQGAVHPFYIDKISSDFARQIEEIRSYNEGAALQREMIYKYCNLVKKHSMKNYSLLVQKVITLIDSDLTADLSLHKQAELLNVNASYLSSLFKKETGTTLTEFVSKKRIEHASFLLTSTNLQIQTIAQHCGIFDVNYFTKTFKKITGKTPKEYREEGKFST